MASLQLLAAISLLIVTTSIHHVNSIQPLVIEEQLIWEYSSSGEVSTYRIPIVIQLPTGDLLAFTEARKYSSSDHGAKFIAMRRSTNGGGSWSPNMYILNDYLVKDGLNLGTVLFDSVNSKIFLMHTFCIHSVCNGTKPSGVYMVTSSDWGYSWSEPVNLGDKNPLLKDYYFDPGPGYGFQKKYAPNKGRLITCGHGYGASLSVDHGSVSCIYSDDGGVMWNLNSGLLSMPYGQSKTSGDFAPGEVQVIELKNGTILANIRNQLGFHCRCRIQAMSFDGGETFPISTLKVKEELIDPGVCGSILNTNDVVFFTSAFNATSRVNLTLHWSFDSGASYRNLLNIYEKGSGYSCLTTIDENHIGIVYEKDPNKYISFVKVRLNP